MLKFQFAVADTGSIGARAPSTVFGQRGHHLDVEVAAVSEAADGAVGAEVDDRVGYSETED